MNSNKKIAVIGDIHGAFNKFYDLYLQLSEHTDEIYAVGDLIDSGPDSKEVIQFCIDKNIKPVMGNHEDLLIKAITNPEFRKYKHYDTNLVHWLECGGNQTVESYIGNSKMDFQKFTKEFKACRHFDFITSMNIKIELPDCIITHGGLIEGKLIENALRNREAPSKLDKIQIFGHTPVPETEIKPNHYVNVDTGCAYGNILSGVLIFSDKIQNFSSDGGKW